jgi:hypothetical protein
LLGRDTPSYLGTDDHTARTIAANGIHLVLDEFRTTTTPKLKSWQPGKTKVAYGDVDAASAWLWKFVDGAKSAGERYGRVLVVFAAQHYAQQLVLARSEPRGSALPASRKDLTRKAFERLTRARCPPRTSSSRSRSSARRAPTPSATPSSRRPRPPTPRRLRTCPSTTTSSTRSFGAGILTALAILAPVVAVVVLLAAAYGAPRGPKRPGLNELPGAAGLAGAGSHPSGAVPVVQAPHGRG